MVEHFGLYLMLVAALGLGFMLGRRERARRRVRRVSEFGSHYFQGINYLLDDRPDLAIDNFIEALPADDASVDAHLTLGAVVRRRGELDSAIRIHQNLLARPRISAENRALAELELARDYLDAGLLDRAEQLLLELIERGGATVRVALEQLVDVYQRERDWPRAIEIATQIGRRGERDNRTALAHFHCEFAEQLRDQGDTDAARNHLKQARRHDRSCPRIGLLLAEIEIDEGRFEQARKELHDLTTVAPGFVGETIELYRRACVALGEPDQLARYLEQNIAAQGDSRVAAALALQFEKSGDVERIEELLIDQLENHPSVTGLRALLAFAVTPGNEMSGRYTSVMLKFVDDMLAHRSLYRCSNCGFAGRRLIWQCPGCRMWGRFVYIGDLS